mgnify:CR=1 FL=1
MKIIGDMSIQNLTPTTTNLGHRMVKNLRMCGSGIYSYAAREAPLLHLDPVPPQYKDLAVINLYRPPEVLEKCKSAFARVPIITGHHLLVTPQNAKDLTVGMVGDQVQSEVDPKDGETYLYSTGTIVAGDGMDAYEQYGQLSVGYDPITHWESGTHNGVPYQAVLDGFNDVNHLLICKIARGGPQCMVMDSLDDETPLERFVERAVLKPIGGNGMGIFKKIFGSVPKIAGDSSVVSVLLQSIAIGADPSTQVQKIKSIMGDSIDDTFSGYLGELEHAGNEDRNVLAKAVDIVDNYYKDHFAGDEKVIDVKKDDKDDTEKKDVEVKENGKETKDIKVEKKDGKKDVQITEPDHAPPKADAPKSSAGDAIDYDKLAETIVAKMAKQTVSGDAVETAIQNQAPELSTIITAGDSDPDALTSDGIMSLIGGK